MITRSADREGSWLVGRRASPYVVRKRSHRRLAAPGRLATLAAVTSSESPSDRVVNPVSGTGPGGAAAGRPMDPESRAWVDELTSPGPVRDDAIARLHALMLRMA